MPFAIAKISWLISFRVFRTRESAVAELKGEKSLPMVIVVFSVFCLALCADLLFQDTDGGSYQGGHGVKNVCVDDPTGTPPRREPTSLTGLVYCSHKRNNVNITFEHAVANIPFELTKIIVKVCPATNNESIDCIDSASRIFLSSQRRSCVCIYGTG